MNEAAALKKALHHACPPRDDPYHHWYYRNKKRELELWIRHGLWPLSKPKDIEHDTGPPDSVEISTNVVGLAVRDYEAASRRGIVDRAPYGVEERIDTCDFDPHEVAKLIEDFTRIDAIETGPTADGQDEMPASFEKTLFSSAPGGPPQRVKNVPRPKPEGSLRKTLRINATLFVDAAKSALENKAVTGGTVSGLVEHLLREHLGSEDKSRKD